MAKHVYAVQGERLVNVKTHVIVGKGDDAKTIEVKFVQNRYQTNDDEVASALDALLKEPMGISSYCRKVDSSAAIRVVQAHMASAAKGGLTASLTNSLENQARVQAQAEMDALTAKVETDPNLALTEPVELPQSGGIEDAKAREDAKRQGEGQKAADVVNVPAKPTIKLGSQL